MRGKKTCFLPCCYHTMVNKVSLNDQLLSGPDSVVINNRNSYKISHNAFPGESDYLDSTETEAEAIELIYKVIDVLSIRSLISNSQQVIPNLPKDLADTTMFTNFDKSNLKKCWA